MGYILAIDVGTTAVKAILVDIATNEMRGASADCTLIQERAAWAEQDADGLWQAVCTAVRRCLSQTAVRPGEVAGLVISAPWKHVIPLDGDCRPLRRGIIWMDGRAAVQAKRLEQLLGAPLENAQGYWSRLLWLKENEPHIWRRARYIAGINAYFRYRATGRLCTECSDDFIHSPDPELQALYDRVLEKTGLAEDRDKFPPCIRCTDLVGPLTRTGAQELGLAPGTPMFGGFGDLPAVYFGAGCAQPGTAHIYIGTSSWFGEFLPRRIGGYSAGWFTASGQAQGALFALTTGGRAYEWAIHRFYRAERQRLGEDIYPFLEGEMGSVEPGCGGLIVTHWLNGEPAPLSTNARGLFFNVTGQHDRRHFLRAMLESICYSHRRSLERYTALHGRGPRRLRVVGGGACSGVWMQMLADVLQLPVHVPPNPRYVGTVGTCRCALIGLGLKADFSDLAQENEEQVFAPNPDNRAVYDKMYGVYCRLFPALEPLYDQLNGI